MNFGAGRNPSSQFALDVHVNVFELGFPFELSSFDVGGNLLQTRDDVARFTESISFDLRLWRHDIQGSKGHATMLQKVGLLTRQELRDIIAGLEEIAADIEAGEFEWKPELED